jgi:alcohol dehydrogenase class IV
MWYFRSPDVVFGEDALDHLAYLNGDQAIIVTDETMVRLGFVEVVKAKLTEAGLNCDVFDQVEPEPSLQTVERGAELMLEKKPDWIVGLGGGSALDAAKAMWILYERPDLAPEEINPIEDLGLRQKARLATIPTTSGTGSESTWAIVLTDTEEGRKIPTGAPECTPDIAIVDPVFAARMPPRLTADTGLDALTHAVEGYTSTWHNDFSDGLCLKAIHVIFTYLPRAFADGGDTQAREKMHNAASLAGLGFINSLTAAAHALLPLPALYHPIQRPGGRGPADPLRRHRPLPGPPRRRRKGRSRQPGVGYPRPGAAGWATAEYPRGAPRSDIRRVCSPARQAGGQRRNGRHHRRQRP